MSQDFYLPGHLTLVVERSSVLILCEMLLCNTQPEILEYKSTYNVSVGDAT